MCLSKFSFSLVFLSCLKLQLSSIYHSMWFSWSLFTVQVLESFIGVSCSHFRSQQYDIVGTSVQQRECISQFTEYFVGTFSKRERKTYGDYRSQQSNIVGTSVQQRWMRESVSQFTGNFVRTFCKRERKTCGDFDLHSLLRPTSNF